MLYLGTVLNLLDHRISDGYDYQWKCYPSARFLNFESDHGIISVVFSTQDQMVYEITADSKKDHDLPPYRWSNPDTVADRKKESAERGTDDKIAFDDVNWADLYTEEDILEKCHGIFYGKSFDHRVEVPLNLTEQEIFQLMTLAHQNDVTLNEMVEMLLKAFISDNIDKLDESKGKK